MKVKSRTLYKDIGRGATRHSYSSNRRLFSRLHACSDGRMRVLVKYDDPKGEYPKGELKNDSGWYTNKAELIKTTKAFINDI